MKIKNIVTISLALFFFIFSNILIFGLGNPSIFPLLYLTLCIGVLIIVITVVRKYLSGLDYAYVIVLGIILSCTAAYFASGVKENIDISRNLSIEMPNLAEENVYLGQKNEYLGGIIESQKEQVISLQQAVGKLQDEITKLISKKSQAVLPIVEAPPLPAEEVAQKGQYEEEYDDDDD